jgi:scyllo-inositol 2-dehydrogenase (NADP+)
MKKIKVGIIGFGLSGRYFHTSLIQAHQGFEIKIVSSSRANEVHAVLPQAQVVSDPYELINNKDLDLIVNCAPNSLHFEYSAAAIKAGKHVVVEKPFVNTIEEGEKLIQLASDHKKILSVFHNRRWDNDFLTVQKLIKNNTLGEIKQFESHFDRWRPIFRPERWKEQNQPGSGILYDLGAHLIDQALTLFGKPQELMADMALQKNGALSDDYFHLILKYKQMRVILHSTSFSNTTPRFQILGDKANFTKFGFDPQEEQLRQNISAKDSSFGVEDTKNNGKLHWPEADLSEIIISEKGSYVQFYEQLYTFITTGSGKNPVSAVEALDVIKIIELARESSRLGKTFKVSEKAT